MYLAIIRGLPGSGKTTLAGTHFPTTPLIEADTWFERPEGYAFEIAEAQRAHAWCLSEVEVNLRQGLEVVVANTFTTLDFLMPYFDLIHRYDIRWRLIEAKGEFESVHGIPEEVMDRMRAQWWEWPFGMHGHASNLPVARCPRCMGPALLDEEVESNVMRCVRNPGHVFVMGERWEI
jgi:hypothetical protein